MSSNAPGQLLGYSLQFPRALLRLLEISPGGAVGIEINGDVSVFFPEGIILSEEDKSSMLGNPLTDRSVNLWKTFYNWCSMLQSEGLSVSNMRFVLYTNHLVNENSFVKWLHEVETTDAINNVVIRIRDFFREIQATHDIHRYLNPLLNDYEAIFREIIPRFELVQNNDTAEIYSDIRVAISSKLVSESYVEPLLERLSGWLQKEINQKIAMKISPIITFDELNHKFSAFFQRLRQAALVDFAINTLPDHDSLKEKAMTKPVYVQQLEGIKAGFDEIIEAVSDFYIADTNRQEWIEREIIDEEAMDDFQKRLVSFHSNHQKTITLTERGASEEVQGQLLLYACKNRHELLNELTPPDKTIPGTYHVLANEKNIGWHPRWETIIANNDGSLGNE